MNNDLIGIKNNIEHNNIMVARTDYTIDTYFSRDKLLVLEHRALNSIYHKQNFDELTNKTDGLVGLCAGKQPILIIEGDLIEHKGELYLAHFNIFERFTLKEFKKRQQDGKAAFFKDAMNYISDVRPETFLNIELKKVIDKGMEKAVMILEDKKLKNRLYDSFSAELLDIAHRVDPNGITSHHLIFYTKNNKPVTLGPHTEHVPTIYTIPYPMASGDPKMAMMYGMVNSKEKFAEVAKKSNVVGISARFDDNSKWKMIKKSFAP